MDKSMIRELAFNSIDYLEKIKVMEIPEYKENSDKFDEICDKLCEGMSEDEKHKILWDLSIAIGCMETVYAEEFFKAGFKVGLTIGVQNLLD